MLTEEQIAALQSELETARGELAKLTQEKEALNGEVTAGKERVAGLEQAVTARDASVAALEQAKEGLSGELAAARKELGEALTGFKDLVVQSSPGLPGELIAGESVTAIRESAERAKQLVERVRQGLESELARARVPAGAPPRLPPDLSGMPPREKIRWALSGKS